MKILKILIVALLGLTSIIVTVNGTCADVLIGESPQTYQCGSPGIFTNSSFQQMPVGGKLLAITGELKIDTYCPPANSPYRFAVVTLDHPTIPGTKIKLFDIYWDVALKRLVFSTEDSNGASIAYYLTALTLPSSSFWYSFSAWTDLSGNVARAVFGLPGKVTESASSLATKSYPSTWTVNMNPTLYLCSDENGANSLGCQISNLKAFYKVPAQYYELRDGTSSTLFAQYLMTQTSGWVITDSVGSLGPAFFGSSTATTEDPVTDHMPSWVPTIDPVTGMKSQHSGVRFTNESQYVTIPTFPIAMSSKSPSYSVTFKFWLLISDYPPFPQERYLFRYSKPDLSINYMGLQLDSNGYLEYMYANRSTRVLPSRQLNKGYWNLIAISYSFRPYAFDGTKHYAHISTQVHRWDDVSMTIDPSEQLPEVFDPTNVVRIGGPPTVIGTISGFEIYNPGSIFISGVEACRAPNHVGQYPCARDIGLSSPSQCLLPWCHSTCGSCLNNTDAGCLSCANNHVLHQGKCVPTVCGAGKYFNVSDYSCNNCISGCNVCTDPTPATCTSCRQGFWKVNGLCECVTGTYLPENATTCATCASKTTNCYQCTQNGTCTRCYNGYLLINGQCVLTSTCPARMYKSLYACIDCTSDCAVCNSLGCTTCDPGFFFYNKLCYTACPVGTFQYSSTTCSRCSTTNCAVCANNYCTSCLPGYLRASTGCVSTCPTGTYSNGTNCVTCSANCNQCNSTTCLTCNTGYLRYNGQCVASCPASTTQSGTECIMPCPANCAQCNSTQCLTCATNYLLHNGQCVSSCPSGFYSTGTECASCSNVATNCAQCTTSQCQGCAPGYLLHNGQCITACPSGFYSTGTICASCSNVASNCAQCDSSECFVCGTGYLLYNGECVTACPTGTYSMCAALGF